MDNSILKYPKIDEQKDKHIQILFEYSVHYVPTV